MKNLHQNRSMWRLDRIILTGLLILVGITTCSVTLAQNRNNFDIRFGESSRLLVADLLEEAGREDEIRPLFGLEHSDLEMEDSCIDPLTRNRLRDRFAILLENTSTTANAITSISIDLVEFGFEFGNGDLTGDGFEGLLIMDTTLSSPGVGFSAMYGAIGTDQSEIVIDFTGLGPDSFAVFRLDLDSTETGPDALVNPDYREVLLGANDMDLALLDVNFAAGRSFSLPIDVGDFDYDINPRRFEAYHGGSMSGRMGPDGRRPVESGDVDGIPEPSSITLTFLALTSLGCLRRVRS